TLIRVYCDKQLHKNSYSLKNFAKLASYRVLQTYNQVAKFTQMLINLGVISNTPIENNDFIKIF
ncbi:MAG: hypothetical protein ACTH6I_07540, partial [Vibrio litoralis]|uniref:hypothetical protein n=1 Tax=Vibrio litoralis TaxID=335972 RepID=UPI003F9DED7B